MNKSRLLRIERDRERWLLDHINDNRRNRTSNVPLHSAWLGFVPDYEEVVRPRGLRGLFRSIFGSGEAA